MNNNLLCAFNRFEGAFDQRATGLGQYLDNNIIGDQILFDDLAHEIKVELRCAGKAHFNLFVTHLDQQIEHRQFAVRIHRIDQRLIAIAQINRTPLRRFSDSLGRPGAVG